MLNYSFEVVFVVMILYHANFSWNAFLFVVYSILLSEEQFFVIVEDRCMKYWITRKILTLLKPQVDLDKNAQ